MSIRWMSGLCPALVGQVVAIDGKTVRGSHQRGQRAIHLVSAYGSGLGMVLGQVRTADKSNEITAIPELLDALLLKGAIVTIDAMGCQSAIAARIIKAGADYVLAVKGNQPSLLTHMRTTLEAIERVPLADREVFITKHREVEKGHGRIDTRRCIASDILTHWQQPALWPGMRSIVMVEATREMGDTVTTERRFYVSSLPPDAAHIANAVRSHWGIENGMHWSFDMAFGEDQCRVRVDHAAQNFAILRRITINLLRRDQTAKGGLTIRRMLACANDKYIAQLPGWRNLGVFTFHARALHYHIRQVTKKPLSFTYMMPTQLQHG
jgi:predicted transposase YbfD/YdcC